MNTNRRKEKTLPKIDPNAVLGVYGMVPPRAIEVEAAVLGGILLEKRAIEDVIGLLPGKEVFYETAHQHVWEAIEQLYRDNQPIDLMTVVDRSLWCDETHNVRCHQRQYPSPLPHLASKVDEKGDRHTGISDGFHVLR
jgi:hypothetical protein